MLHTWLNFFSYFHFGVAISRLFQNNNSIFLQTAIFTVFSRWSVPLGTAIAAHILSNQHIFVSFRHPILCDTTSIMDPRHATTANPCWWCDNARTYDNCRIQSSLLKFLWDEIYFKSRRLYEIVLLDALVSASVSEIPSLP